MDNSSTNKNVETGEASRPFIINQECPSDIISTTVTKPPVFIDTQSSVLFKPSRYQYSDEKLTKQLISLIRGDHFEYGCSSYSEIFVEELLKHQPIITMQLLNEIMLEYFSQTKIVVGILHILSHLDYETVYPQGQTMAGMALSHQSVEVREMAVKAFENWGNAHSVIFLKSVRIEEKWLSDYVSQLISDLEEELM